MFDSQVEEPMTPDDEISILLKLITASPEASEEEVYQKLAAQGISARNADCTYKFTQIAWGRTVLHGMGITFSDDYFWLDADGKVVESGEVEQNPYFIAAMKVAANYSGNRRGITRMAASASEFHVVNDMLNNGSKPEDLKLAPCCMFTTAPTQAGLKRAQDFINSLLRSSGNSEPDRVITKKPWWKFWQNQWK